MALKFNNTDITQVYFNGTEKMALKYNGVGYFGKRFSLTKNTSTGVSLTIKRTSSPNQRATTGTISTGNTIYYGDVITITCTASSGYTNPKLYVNTGSGMVLRSSPYSFTVTGNVTFYGTATQADAWQTIWSGTKTFTASGSFSVPGLSTSGKVQVTANIIFKEGYVQWDTGATMEGNTYTGALNRTTLPATVYGLRSNVEFSKSGSNINVTFNPAMEYAKGYDIYESPVSLTITEVRWQA